ncbi:MAG: hypothetical protein ACM31D_06510 [Bacteroidota bacterium]
MGAQIDWRPYIMFFHANNYASPVINTDRFGFRLSHRTTGEPVAVADAIEENAAERRKNRDVVIDHVGRILEVWAMLARGMNFQPVYALQPILGWTGKPLSPEETALLDERDALGLPWHRMLGQISDADHYQWYRDAIESRCRQLGIGFIDTNAALRHRADWLFIDRLHLTDAGQNACAEAIAAALA